jgi:hypothetical protein
MQQGQAGALDSRLPCVMIVVQPRQLRQRRLKLSLGQTNPRESRGSILNTLFLERKAITDAKRLPATTFHSRMRKFAIAPPDWSEDAPRGQPAP